MSSLENEPMAPAEGDSPVLLRDTDGRPIIPAGCLSGVDFSAHLKDTQTAAPRRQAPDPSGAARPSYFTAQPGQVTTPNGEPPKQDASTPLIHSKPRPSESAALMRMNTAPAQDLQRPSTLARSSTLLRSLRRRPTRADEDQRRDEPLQYVFDPMSSESDSTDDDTAATNRVTAANTAANCNTKNAPPKVDANSKRQRALRGHSYSRFKIGNENFETRGHVSKKDGRLSISVNETAHSGYIAKALGQSIKHHLDIPHKERERKKRQHNADHASQVRSNGGRNDEGVQSSAASGAEALHASKSWPHLNIVIMVIGSRGDIQPFLKIAQILSKEHGHRVRVATHPTFRDFVEKDCGLEFFSVGGNPAELMAFMVKNPGLIPSMQTIREGEIQRRRAAMGEMFEGMWRACINTVDDEKDKLNIKMMGNKPPFIADAIIANPPSMAHVHIAEKLGIPLHIMFTFPYSPTQAFPHPLANTNSQKSNVDPNYVNFMSYPLVEMMTWQGLGAIVNRFRQQTLKLEPVSSLWAPGALYRMKVPYTYMWSPSLVPKPSDWGPEIDIAGFVFLDLANNFKPPEELVKFLEAGEPPVYIGFGSIVVDDPKKFTNMIFRAVKLAGVRALVNEGWGGLGGDGADVPENIYMLGNTPHDWLFPKCKAVVHHGGAGTTAAGLKCAKPTMIVPFFGDQPFWGARVAEAKAGAHECIPYKKLNAEKFAEGIKQCLTDEAQKNVRKLADAIAKEGDGAANAVKSFHRSLPLAGDHNMRCSILEDRAAVWVLRGSSLRLSELAAELLLRSGKIKLGDLDLLRHYEWNDFDGAGEPVTGFVGAMTESLYGIGEGVGMVPVRMANHIRERQEHEQKRQRILQKREERQRRKEAARNTNSDAAAGKDTSDPKQELSSQPQTNPRDPMRRTETSTTTETQISADPSISLPRQIAADVGHGFKRSGVALSTMPVDLVMAVAQGFHNAPRLWGDASVRKPVKITGVKTGFVAAGKEFSYGVYDGFTGLITQPVGGWQDGDTIGSKFAGFGTGVGKGLGGFVLKNLSAVVSPPAYVSKGVVVYCKKKAEGPGSKSFIRRAHLISGQRDLQKLQATKDRHPGHRGSTTAGTDKSNELQNIQDAVSEGWQTYEDIWDQARRQFGPLSNNHVINKFKYSKERRRWITSGALDNVHTAGDALETQRRGGNLEKHFRLRRKERDLAQKPRASAMAQPNEYQKHDDVLPNGRKTQELDGRVGDERENEQGAAATDPDVREDIATGGDQLKHDPPTAAADDDATSSDSTYVATPPAMNPNGESNIKYAPHPDTTDKADFPTAAKLQSHTKADHLGQVDLTAQDSRPDDLTASKQNPRHPHLKNFLPSKLGDGGKGLAPGMGPAALLNKGIVAS